MKRKEILLFTAALWFFVAGTWTVLLGADIYYRVTPGWLMALHGITAVTSWIAAVTNYMRYKKGKLDGKEEHL